MSGSSEPTMRLKGNIQWLALISAFGMVACAAAHEPPVSRETAALNGTSTLEVSALAPNTAPINGWGPYEINKSNGEISSGDGRTLSIAGTSFSTGLGVHANSELSFSVPAECHTLSAQVGIDDEVGARGSVIFEVWDGTATRLYQSAVKHGGESASAVDVALGAANTLRLVVTNGGDDNSYDHADWADAKLLCGEADGGSDDPNTPGDDRAGYISCGNQTCEPGEFCNGGCRPLNSGTVQPSPVYCDGPEDCEEGQSCVSGISHYGTSCRDALDYQWPTARCHTAADCPETGDSCVSSYCRAAQ